MNLVQSIGTAYYWHLSLSSGLKQLSDRFYPDPRVIKFHLKGDKGTRVWKIKAVAKGHQQVTGICKSNWGPVTGNEQTFTLNVRVV